MTHFSERHNTLPRAATLLLAVVCMLLVCAASASAASFVVDTSADDPGANVCSGAADDCSLRGAIDKANDDVATDTLSFSVSNANLEAPLPPVTKKLVINGAGTTVTGTITYVTNCGLTDYAFDTTGAEVALNRLPIYSVCSRPIKSNVPAPVLQVGPRKADNTVSFNGSGAGVSADIYRADPPAGSGEARQYFESAVAPGGVFTSPLVTIPPLADKFTATITDASGRTSSYSATASTPSDLTSPILNNAVAINNNLVRLDFSESINGAVTGLNGAFGLKMGTVNRQVTSTNVSGNTVYLGSSTTPWVTGDAGVVGLTGAGRVSDVVGNEVFGTPSKTVYAGPGKLTVPVISKYRANPTKYCQRKTSKCRRGQTYLYITLSEDARVVFNVYRVKGRKFVVRYVRKLPKGTSKTRLFGTINGRTLPATSLLVNAVAEDTARNLSAPVDAPFKVVTRKSKL